MAEAHAETQTVKFKIITFVPGHHRDTKREGEPKSKNTSVAEPCKDITRNDHPKQAPQGIKPVVTRSDMLEKLQLLRDLLEEERNSVDQKIFEEAEQTLEEAEELIKAKYPIYKEIL